MGFNPIRSILGWRGGGLLSGLIGDLLLLLLRNYYFVLLSYVNVPISAKKL